MSLAGNWIMTQIWQGIPPYKFGATFGADGTITVEGGYFGTWTVLGSSNQVSLAIAQCPGPSVTSYVGNVAGPAMGGQMTGGTPGGKIHNGMWSASQQAHIDAPTGALKAPGEGQ
jgi:hypothetical protein